MLGHDPTASTAENYRRFAALEARGTSPVYERICAAISSDRELLAFLGEQPARCRQPNLLLGVVRYAFGTQATYPAFRETVLGNRHHIAELLHHRRTQTNEPGRCTALLPLLAALPQPLALLEVGASAGLCLIPDRYGYRYDDTLIPGGPPVLSCRTVGGMPPIPERLPEIVWRKGIDLEPLDVTDADDVHWLESLVWPGQADRERHLREALALAREDPPEVVRGDLVESLEDVAAQAPADATLVVFHTAVLGYLSPEQRADFTRRVQALDAAWIASEAPGVLGAPAGPGALLERGHFVLTVGGTLYAPEPVARMGPHGDWLEWAESSAGPSMPQCTGR